jgi:hypothetical protein
MQQEAIKKITDSVKECAEKRVPAEPIAEFLKKKCGDDEEFAALIMKEHKTLDKCFSFVYEQVKKHLNGSNGWVDDNEVYLMSADYFRLDDEEIERKKAEEEAKRNEERRIQEEDRQRKADEDKKQKDFEKKQKAAATKLPEGQMSLFGD